MNILRFGDELEFDFFHDNPSQSFIEGWPNPATLRENLNCQRWRASLCWKEIERGGDNPSWTKKKHLCFRWIRGQTRSIVKAKSTFVFLSLQKGLFVWPSTEQGTFPPLPHPARRRFIWCVFSNSKHRYYSHLCCLLRNKEPTLWEEQKLSAIILAQTDGESFFGWTQMKIQDCSLGGSTPKCQVRPPKCKLFWCAYSVYLMRGNPGNLKAQFRDRVDATLPCVCFWSFCQKVTLHEGALDRHVKTFWRLFFAGGAFTSNLSPTLFHPIRHTHTHTHTHTRQQTGHFSGSIISGYLPVKNKVQCLMQRNQDCSDAENHIKRKIYESRINRTETLSKSDRVTCYDLLWVALIPDMSDKSVCSTKTSHLCFLLHIIFFKFPSWNWPSWSEAKSIFAVHRRLCCRTVYWGHSPPVSSHQQRTTKAGFSSSQMEIKRKVTDRVAKLTEPQEKKALKPTEQQNPEASQKVRKRTFFVRPVWKTALTWKIKRTRRRIGNTKGLISERCFRDETSHTQESDGSHTKGLSKEYRCTAWKHANVWNLLKTSAAVSRRGTQSVVHMAPARDLPILCMIYIFPLSLQLLEGKVNGQFVCEQLCKLVAFYFFGSEEYQTN